MNRRDFLSMLSGSLLAVPLVATAQQAAMVHRIGYLELNRTDTNPRLSSAFREGLRSLGYVEGRNVVIEYRSAEGKPERLAAGDPRRSLEERYVNHAGYVEAFAKAARKLRREGYLLPEDVKRYADEAQASDVLK